MSGIITVPNPRKCSRKVFYSLFRVDQPIRKKRSVVKLGIFNGLVVTKERRCKNMQNDYYVEIVCSRSKE